MYKIYSERVYADGSKKITWEFDNLTFFYQVVKAIDEMRLDPRQLLPYMFICDKRYLDNGKRKIQPIYHFTYENGDQVFIYIEEEVTEND